MKKELKALLSRYFVYACVGVVVTLVAIFLRAMISRFMPADSPNYYALSIGITYGIGFTLSYSGHRFITFQQVTEMARSQGASFVLFVLIAMLGMLVAMMVSLFVRYQTPLAQLAGNDAPSVAFAAGVVVASVLTFSLNSSITFRSRTACAKDYQTGHE
jgi:putative flippase GtrA